MELIAILLVNAVFLSLFFTIGYLVNKKIYNKGICRKCGGKMKYFDTASNFSNGYYCEKCHNTEWVGLGADKE